MAKTSRDGRPKRKQVKMLVLESLSLKIIQNFDVGEGHGAMINKVSGHGQSWDIYSEKMGWKISYRTGCNGSKRS